MRIVGNPGCPRVAGFQAALTRSGRPPAALVPWLDVIAGRASPDPSALVRLESPGREWDVEKALIAEGADAAEDGSSRIARSDALALEFDKGRLWFPRQWFLGFRAVLRRLSHALGAGLRPRPGRDRRSPLPEAEHQGRPSVQHGAGSETRAQRLPHFLNPPADVETLFDKEACQERFAAGVPIPRGLGRVRSFDELRERMREQRCPAAFVKLWHGSSASGVVA
ncbi:MAG: hypothetical protein K2W96_04785, partial [Gemmataceae bacterium]|nr:hypothetical protein [Gemmataceae bacterium]